MLAIIPAQMNIINPKKITSNDNTNVGNAYQVIFLLGIGKDEI